MITRFSLRSWVVLVVVAAVAAATVVVVIADRDHNAPGAVDASTASSLSASAHDVDTIPMGSVHDGLGAVSTAVAVTRAQIGFDPDQAAAVAAVYADPAERAAFEDLARGAVAARRAQAGVGSTEAAPPPASYAATPLAYTVDEVAPDQLAVHVLSWITLTSTTAEIKDHLYVGTQVLRWSDDWRLVMPTADLRRDLAEQQPPAATPGSRAFTRAGWVLIEDVNR